MNQLVKRKRNEKGFTLIEIIAVLIILGILAAVAVPKFLNLTEEAQKRALDGAVAAGLSHVSLAYAAESLNRGRSASQAEILTRTGATLPDSDFTVTFAASGSSDVSVTASKDGQTKTATWRHPG